MQDAVAAEPEDEVPEEFRTAEPEPVIAACGRGKWDVWLGVTGLAALLVFATVQLVETLLRGRYGEAAFIVVPTCVVAYWAYQCGWRRPYRVELTRTTLRWLAPLRRVEVPLLSIRRVHLAWGRNKAKKLVIDGPRPGRTRSLPLHEVQDIDPFLSILKTAAPGVELRGNPLSIQQRQL